MAADVVLEAESTNPCCVELKKKYSSMEESMNALREGAKLFEELAEKLIREKTHLKKACEKERMRGDQEKEAKEKVSIIRYELEKELHNLKAELSSYQKSGGLRILDGDETKHLEAIILEGEAEIKRLRALIKEEENRRDFEKKRAEEEKEKAAEARKLLKLEKSKAEENRRLVEIERNKAEDCRLSMEKLKSESIEVRAKLIVEKSKAEEEKEKASEARKLLMMEKSKAEENRRLVETERSKAEDCRLSLEKLKSESNEVRAKLIVEKSKADDAIKKVEAERQKACKEKMRADLESVKSEEQKKLMEIVKKKVMDEKSLVDRLSQALEEEKQRREELQKKIEETVSSQSGRKKCSCLGHGKCKSGTIKENADVNLLRKQLKLEKKCVKYAKRMVQLEKAERSFIVQELDLLKHEFIQLSSRLNMLDGRPSYNAEGKAGLTKIKKSPEQLGSNLQNKFLSVRPRNVNPKSDLRLANSYHNDSSNFSGSSKECTSNLSRGGCTRSMPGISSELESPIIDFVRNKPQSSVVCSTATTFSDRTFMGSQGRDDPFTTTSAKLTGNYLNQRSAVRKLASEVGKIKQNENSLVVTENIDISCAQRNVGNVYLNSSFQDGTGIAERISSHSLKRRRIQETLESIAMLYSEDNKLHLKMGEKISALKDVLSFNPATLCSPSCEVSNSLDNGWLLTEKNGDRCIQNYKPGGNTVEQKRQKIDSQSFCLYDNLQQIVMFEGEGNRKPSFISEIAAPGNQMQENVNICVEESTNAVSSGRAALICFENLVCGDYLKLLELDNDDDERRYKTAVEQPLSPTLPEINSPRFQLDGEDESVDFVEGLLRRFESERDNSVSFQTFDVIDLEINSNMVEQKASNPKALLSDSNRDFTYSSEERKCSGMFTSHNDFNRNGTTRTKFLDVEKVSDTRESNDLMNSADLSSSLMALQGPCWKAMPLVKCPFDPNEISNLSASPDALSGKIYTHSPSGGASDGYSNSSVDSKQINEIKCAQSCNVEIHNLAKSTFPIENGPEKALGTAEVPSSGLIENLIEGEGKELDNTLIAQCVNHVFVDSGTRKLTDGENNIFSAGEAAQTSIQLVSESRTTTESAKQMPLLAIGNVEDPCRGHEALVRIPKYCVVFSKTKDEGSIPRIIHVSETLIYQSFVVPPDSFITEVLRALTLESDLLPEEKVSVFFSLLLYNFSATISTNSKSAIDGDILHCSESFSMNINRVICEGETKLLFQETCRLDFLLNLIEDFLLNRKILMYDVEPERLYPHVSSNKSHPFEGGNMCFSCRAATVDQLVAASVILSCICAAVDYVGFLLEASYKFLLMCRNDTPWVLQTLHIFASVIGNNFFTASNHGFLVTAIKSIVSLLERGHESLSPCLRSLCDMSISYPRCEQCPFYTDAISVRKFTSLLLDVLQDYASGVRRTNLNKVIASSVYTLPSCDERENEGTDWKYEFDDLNIDCNASCVLYKYGKHVSDQSNCVSDSTFCHYTDIVSLVELVGCYMSWDWTSNNVMPNILEMLESCKSEEVSAALFVLIGQLARFGIDAGGYQQGGVTELRCRLSMFLETFVATKRSFLTQFVVVGSLLNLLPLSFEEIVNGDTTHSLDESQSSHAKLIKKWFFQLSRELQSSSLSLLRHTDVQNF